MMPDPLIQPGDEFLYEGWEPIPGSGYYDRRHVYMWLPHDYRAFSSVQCDGYDDIASYVKVDPDVLVVRRGGKFLGYTCWLCRVADFEGMQRLHWGNPRDHGWLCPQHEAEMRQAMEGM